MLATALLSPLRRADTAFATSAGDLDLSFGTGIVLEPWPNGVTILEWVNRSGAAVDVALLSDRDRNKPLKTAQRSSHCHRLRPAARIPTPQKEVER